MLGFREEQVMRDCVTVLVFSLALAHATDSRAERPAADRPYRPPPANLAARREFQDAKFGLFVHFGVYSVPAGEYKGQTVKGIGEWIMDKLEIPIPEYERFAGQFNPTEFDPSEWVRLVKQAGMKYITITSKHHDGFALWDSKVSDWDIVDRTPYKKDLLKLLADECHKQGIKLFFYHSQLDWHHPDYFPRGRTGHHSGRPESGDFNKYLDYQDAQLTELLGGRYGKIAGIWFDGWWDQQVQRGGPDPKKTKVDWRLRRTYDLIHRLQPQALVGNNHHVLPFPGEDFQMFEKDLPGQSTSDFNVDAKIGSLPLETCETTNDSWGYKKADKNFKSPAKLVALLVGAAGRNANLLLNVGPQPDGRFPPEARKQLEELGVWTSRYGDSIYGTRGGPVAPQPWGVTTQKAGRVFVHVLAKEAASGDEIPLPGLTGKVKRASLLKDRTPVRFDPARNALILPRALRDDIDTIVVVEVR
jgi:alpha-L-fucosidase